MIEEINHLHDQAMDLADRADLAKRRGRAEEANLFYKQALEYEIQAANSVDIVDEPTRSVLYRSAASLALDSGEIKIAERLVATALIGNPPPEIADELREMFDQVNFERHLGLRGIELGTGEFQLSIAGSAIGPGIAPTELFLGRLRDVERIIYRTAQRKSGVAFSDTETLKKEDGRFKLYVTPPRSASFAVTLRIGAQPGLPGFDNSDDVIDEVVDCLTLLSNAEDQELEDRIKEETYYRNFVALAGRLAPDGKDVTLVGLTTNHNGKEKTVNVTRSKKDIANASRKKTSSERQVSITGALRYADSLDANEIKLVDEHGDKHTIIVPEGIMTDIVRPLWESIVVVTGTRYRKKVRLETIEAKSVKPGNSQTSLAKT